MGTTLADRSCEIGGHRWDLQYTASALKAVQMTMGDLTELSAKLVAENFGAGMPLRSQALLVWAGQRAVRPKLKFEWVQKVLNNMAGEGRTLLLAWAAADFCTAIMRRTDAQIRAANPEAFVDADEDSDEATITVRFGGSDWTLAFDMGALWQIEQRTAPGSDTLDGIIEALTNLAAEQIDALAVFVWAGLLHADPSLTVDAALSLLDAASPAELALLPEQVAQQFKQVLEGGKEGGGGSPWSWRMIKAVWVTQWGRPLEELWRTSLREFGDLSDGLAALYEASKEDQGKRGTTDSSFDGWTLEEMLTPGRLRG